MKLTFLSAGIALAFAQTLFAGGYTTLPANPGPANNNLGTGAAIFFDLTAPSTNLVVTEMTTASGALAGGAFTVEVFTRIGTALGGPVGAGPGSSSVGWTSLGTAAATQGGTASGISLPINIPDIELTAGQLTGVAVVFTGAGPRYFGVGTPPYGTYSDAHLSIQTGDARNMPFTPSGTFFSSRELVGSLTYAIASTITANPGPANNNLGTGAAIFFDLTALSTDLVVTGMTTASTAGAGGAFTVGVFTRVGTALGGPVGSGPGSSSVGWTSLGTAAATQGGTASGISLPINIPDIGLTAGQLTGVAVVFTGAGPRYFGVGTPPYGTYSDAHLSIQTGDARNMPFTTSGTFFSSREMVGSLTYTGSDLIFKDGFQ